MLHGDAIDPFDMSGSHRETPSNDGLTYVRYRQAAESIKQKRSEILRDAATEPVDPAEAQASGRLLLYEAMETVSDGSAEALSHGFFDMEDAPPWDTWFWCKEDTIFCWVPDSLVSYAQAGIDANPPAERLTGTPLPPRSWLIPSNPLIPAKRRFEQLR